MDFFGTKFRDTAQAMYNSILKRAEVFANENSSSICAIEIGPDLNTNVQVEDLKREYLGFFALNQIDLKYPCFDNSIINPNSSREATKGNKPICEGR